MGGGDSLLNLSDVHFAIPYLSLLVRFVEKVIQSSQDWSCPTKSKLIDSVAVFLCRILLMLDRYQVLYASKHISDAYTTTRKLLKKKVTSQLADGSHTQAYEDGGNITVQSFFTVSLFSRTNENVDRCQSTCDFTSSMESLSFLIIPIY